MKVHRIEIVRKSSQFWYWHAIARNGRKLGWTGEPYTKRSHTIAELIAVVDPFFRCIPVYEVNADGKTKKRINEHGEPFFS